MSAIVLITGASSGIGAACARAFARNGSRLLLAARRRERLEGSKPELLRLGAPDIHTLQLDVRDSAAVLHAIGGLPEPWRAIEVLINDAGLSRGLEPLQEGSIQDWDEMVDTNVKGLLYVDRAVIPGMVERGRGMVVHIGSIAGRQAYPGGAVYCATKAAVRAITEGLRIDLLGTGVRVASVDPGLVETEFSIVRFHGDRERAAKTYTGMRPLTGDDVADIVLFVATRPEHVVVAESLVLPADQASALHVNRKR